MNDSENVLSDLDIVFQKLRIWLPNALREIRAKPEHIEQVENALALDVLVLLPTIKKMLCQHRTGLLKRDVFYCRVELFPPEYKEVEIPTHIAAKGFDFVEVIIELLEQLERE